MSEKPESDEFEEEDAEDTPPGGDDVDVEDENGEDAEAEAEEKPVRKRKKHS
jgi:hypothetical protein